MSDGNQLTILCLASYFKGTTFLTAAKRQGARVILLTREKIKDEAWPREDIDEIFLMPDLSKRPDIIYAVSYLMRENNIVQIVPLDDYDVETAAALREHLRLPGLGETVARYFRDKLAMRLQARQSGLLVPEFTPVFNYDRLRDFMDRVPPPWVLKPRSEAGAMGIKKVHSAEEVWRWLDELGDQQSFFHMEHYIPGEVYHVDSIVWDGQVQFALPHKYTQPPMNVAHQGGVFVTRTLARDSEEGQMLLSFNEKLLQAFAMPRGVTHAEFIRGEDGRYYFLETAARVGGANIEQLVEAASGVNLWAEWAILEIAFARGESYSAPKDSGGYAGVLICLSRQEYPDMSSFQEPEVVFRLEKKHHAGLIVASMDQDRVESLISSYDVRFADEFLAVAPPLDKPPS